MTADRTLAEAMGLTTQETAELREKAEALGRVLGSDASRAVDRFRPDGPSGYRAATAPSAPLRASRAEAVADERVWLERSHA